MSKVAIISWFLAGGLGGVLWNRWRREQRLARLDATRATGGAPAAAASGSPELRRMILTREIFAGGTAGDEDVVRAVVMDWCIAGDDAVTLASFDDDTTSLYYSNGGGVIGTGSHDAVRRVATLFRAEAVRERMRFSPATVFLLPPSATIVFHLVTERATLSTAVIPTDVLKAGTHPLSSLANRAQELIYRIGEASQGTGT